MDISNLKQSLLEDIADWLDSEDVVYEQILSGLHDPKPREQSDLHIKMTEAAMKVYEEEMVELYSNKS